MKVEASEMGRSSSSRDRGSNRAKSRDKFDAPAKNGNLDGGFESILRP